MSGEMPGKFEGSSGEWQVARFGSVTLDPDARRVLRDHVELHLTPKAFDLLALLVREAPRVVSKEELHGRLWRDSFVSDSALGSLIKEIRRVLDRSDAAQSVIRTVHGVGYALALPVEGSAGTPATAHWHWIEAVGRHIRLVEGENVIGRDPSCRVWLDMASVSRRHARILLDGDGAWLEDLGSKNRTKLDAQAVAGRTLLDDGAQIQVGPIHLVYRRSREGMSTETHVDA